PGIIFRALKEKPGSAGLFLCRITSSIKSLISNVAGRDLEISAFRAPIFRSAYGDLKIPAQGRCGLKTTRSKQLEIFQCGWPRSSDLGLSGADLQIGIRGSEDPRPGALWSEDHTQRIANPH